MTRKDAHRVARYHATNPGCTPFPYRRGGIKFTDDVWRRHFEGDLCDILADSRRRKPVDDEVALIEAFIEDRR